MRTRAARLTHPVAVVPPAGKAGRTGRVKPPRSGGLRRAARSARLTGRTTATRQGARPQGFPPSRSQKSPGGGFLLFYAENAYRLRRAMRKAGLRELHVHMDVEGTRVVNR